MHIEQFGKIITENGLYESAFDGSNLELIIKFRSIEYTFDSFCVNCKTNSTYQHKNSIYPRVGGIHPGVSHHIANNLVWAISGETRNETLADGFSFEEVCICTRCKKQKIVSQFIVSEGKVVKCGQFPSIADLSHDSSKKYRKVLGSYYNEFTKAIGLASHGIGIGSFVYLRRIVERLVNEALERKITAGEIGRDELIKLRFSEKMLKVKDQLPGFLTENKQIYGVLSKGVHELDEKICVEYFGLLKNAIEIILDEQIEIDARNRKRKETEKILAGIKS